ncbi:DUF4349 domain-containing protein [Anaerosalibacter sp. Marseille-P3206]|uniref:DUF4349 domain-containing protein n=1 Tax=Anaerosalibacter sp. Marseille-P3206 TaxID=1871005 RepID=UPI00135655E3|nr:DUF4349 domain-containing protein [Anaerosalibacter sp. Marseille-P3206]
MRKFQKYLILGLILFLILSSLTGCGSKESSDNSSSNEMNLAPTEESKKERGNNEEASPLEPEKVITTVYIQLKTTEFEKANKDLNALISKNNAYVENSQINYNQHYNNKSYRNGFYLIRVPKDKISSFKSGLNGVGNVVSESTTKQDVTSEYRDTESRLKVLEVKEERILALLSKAGKMEDIIKLENELSETIYEKERLKTNLINIDDKVDFSTFEINIEEVERLTNQETTDTTFGGKLVNAFKNSLFSFRKVLETFVISIIYILPFAVVIGAIAYFVIKFIMKRKK